MAAVSITPASGSITAASTVCKINATAVDSNDATAYDANLDPSEPELRYYFELSKSGTDSLISHTFSSSSDGLHQWDNVIFPVAGSWTLTLRDASDDSSVASAGVTVS